MEKADEPSVYDERHWTDVNKRGLSAYDKSKVMAEKSAWEYWESLPENERFELTTVCPGAIFGPSLIGGGFASGQIIEMFLNNSFPGGVP